MLQEIRPGRPREEEVLPDPNVGPEQSLGVRETPPEISNYLFRFLSGKRKPVDLGSIFRADHEIYRRIGKYEKDLALFLREPESQEVGRSLLEGEERIKILQLEYNNSRDGLDGLTNELEARRQSFLYQRQQLEQRVATLGKEATWEEAGLLVGRIRVRLWQLKRQNRLSLLGSILYRVIGSLPAHPAVLPVLGEIGRVEEQINAKKREKEELGDRFVEDKVLEGKKIVSGTVGFLEILDRWAGEDLDRTIVHFLYYQNPGTLELYSRMHDLDSRAHRDFLQSMVRYGLPQDYVRPNLVLRRDEVVGASSTISLQENKDTNILPIEVIVGGYTFADRDEAREAVFGLMKNFAKEQKQMVWQVLVNELKFLAQGFHSKRFTTYHAQDMIRKMGGNSRIRVDRLRVVTNRTRREGKRILEVVRVVDRDDPEYQ